MFILTWVFFLDRLCSLQDDERLELESKALEEKMATSSNKEKH
jgi:hypothetical protein